MKTKYFILTMALSAMVVGCNKEQEKEEVVKGGFIFSSSTGDATKAGLASNNTLYWTAGDQLAIYSYNGDDIVCQDIATLYSGEGTSTGQFAPETFSENTNWYNPEAASIDYDFYAWYPATTAVAPVSKVVSVSNVSSEQSETVGFGDYLVCWAKTETSKGLLAAGTAPSFTFTPKSALLKLTVKNSTASAITIYSIKLSADANISGEADLNLETGTLGEGSRNDITYYPMSPIVIEAGNKSWVPVNISLLPCDATSIAISLEGCDAECSENLAFSGIESGRVYSKQAIITPPPSPPERSVVINNSTTKTASSDVLEANKLYYGKANCLVMGASDTQGTLNIQLFASSDGFARSDLASSYTSAVTSAKVIWAENDLYNDANFGIIGANLNTLTISKSSGVTGNALVGIYQGEDILWSYHIWCPSDNTVYQNFESELGTVFDSVYKLALGQISGEQTDSYMYYQWGRKDPQGRAASLSNTLSLFAINGASFTSVGASSTDEEANNLAYARKNPTTFLGQNNTTLFDWYPSQSTMTAQSNQENRLWNSTAATIYDPCPEGYHVAPKTLWEGTKSSGDFSAGMTTKLWYVLGGNRFRYDGKVSNVSSYGNYWSSEVFTNPVKSITLQIVSKTGAMVTGGSERADGKGVRCVKD